MEMSLEEEIVQIALKLKCDQATLVPENRQEITTEGGLDAAVHVARLKEVAARLQDAGVQVSAFVDPDDRQIDACVRAGCDAIEIHTGAYANACLAQRSRPRRRNMPPGGDAVLSALEAVAHGLEFGVNHGLEVHGGHGLTYNNILPVAAMRGFGEFNIGHSIIARAVFTGLREAVAEMKRLIVQAGRRA
jgi:pyridoxine 5-phosphate synthase